MQARVGLLFFAIVEVAACGTPSGQCSETGGACSLPTDPTTRDCCPGYVCRADRKCALNACLQSDGACRTTDDCCPSLACGNGVFGTDGRCTAQCSGEGKECGPSHGGQICCAGAGACVTGCCGGACASTCATAGELCSTASQCCAGLTCPRFGTTCAKGQIGDPCRSGADCVSNQCDGWCTQPCVTDAGCGATNYCISVDPSVSKFLCFPFCQKNSDCAIYKAASCKQGADPDGLMLSVCSG